MLDLEAKFSPRIIPASTEYPYGELKPNTATASNDGTPVTAAVGNDIEGFKQAAITRASIEPSGSPDTAINSQLLDSLDKRYLEIDYQIWTFATGGLLTNCSQAVKHTNNKWYSWSGVFPDGGKVVTAGTDPTADVGYVSRVTPFEHLPVTGASSTDNTGTTYVQDLIFDTYGHVTGLVSTEIREGNTSQTGIVKLTDSTSSTSITTAATPNSVKNTYDLASAAIPSAQKGVVGGVATLDGSGKVPTTQLPSASEIGAVPATRTVNSKPLSGDVILTASDVGALEANANAVSASKWQTARTLTFTGDSTGSGAIDGSGNVSIALTLANSGATAGTYKSVTVDAKGRITAGTNPTTLAEYGITDAAASSHVGATGTAHGDVTTSVAGFMSAVDKTKLDGIETGANAYIHPTGDGNLHVPANGTTSDGYVLKAGSTAGSISWGQLTATDVNAYSKTEMPYEKGTFTPIVSGGTTTGTCTYITQLGRYTRIGNRVFYTATVVWSGHTGTGTLRISLPLTSNAISSNNPISSILSTGLTFTNTPVGITPSASSLILVRENKPGAAMADIPIQAAGTVIMSGVYEI